MTENNLSVYRPCIIQAEGIMGMTLGWSKNHKNWTYKANPESQWLCWEDPFSPKHPSRNKWETLKVAQQQLLLSLISRDRAILVEAALQGHRVAQECLKLLDVCIQDSET